ncbi:MAG TPA: RIP metalloprotease RseP [Candidatus Omnitrophica bacterium]|nr:RIP metalloprotease RseP [Candidatus Omnitrophota bacterium]
MSFLIFIVCISILIFIHELGHFIAARRAGVTVEVFSLGFGPKLLTRKKGDTIYQLCAIPLGGYIKMAGDSRKECTGKSNEYLSSSCGHRASIVVSGGILNYLLGFICFSVALVFGIPDYSSTVGTLLEGYPAQEAGLLPGDKIVSIDDKKISLWGELITNIQDKNGQSVDIDLIRAGELLELRVSTRLEEIDTVRGKVEISFIGIGPGYLKYGIKDAVVVGAREYLKFTAFYYRALGDMLTGKISLKKSATGLIGIYKITTNAASMGMGPLLNVLAIINLALAIFNLLPFPILDGGHLLLIGIEKIRGKPISIKIEDALNKLGITLLIFLLVFVTINDFVRFGLWDGMVVFFKALIK